LKEYTKEEIEQMDYSSMVGLVRERNRPSGGIKTISTVLRNSFLTNESKVLEIGSNTGFTSVNIALLRNCNVVGIDINENSINEAKQYSSSHKVANLTNFKKCDASDLPFKSENFDLVWCSNVTSFIEDKNKTIKEYLRVLKYGGVLVVIPIYYKINPPKEVVVEVSKAIGTKIEVMSKAKWIDLFKKISKDYGTPLELYFDEDHVYLDMEKEIESYVSEILKEKPQIESMSPGIKELIKKRFKYFINLFNNNLKYCGFSILLFQKRHITEERELFLSN